MAMPAMTLVILYLAITGPMALVMLKVHGLRSDYTRLFMLAMFLQLIPVGLIFLPLGVIGLALLAYTLGATVLRNRKFRRMAIHNPEVHRQWTVEAIAHFAALGLAVEQKLIALAFMSVVSRQPGPWWAWLIAGSVVIGAVTGLAIARERRILKAIGDPG